MLYGDAALVDGELAQAVPAPDRAGNDVEGRRAARRGGARIEVGGQTVGAIGAGLLFLPGSKRTMATATLLAVGQGLQIAHLRRRERQLDRSVVYCDCMLLNPSRRI